MDFSFEQKLWAQGYNLVAGVDEAGRGPLAGPVVAAAVILSRKGACAQTCEEIPSGLIKLIKEIKDSKKISARKREELFREISSRAYSIGTGIVDNRLIDSADILEATLLAMRKAVFALKAPPDYILVDGLHVPFPQEHSVPQFPVVRGDGLVASIAAASIIAKVFRDRIMIDAAQDYSEYGFEKHKGYPTKEHIALLKRFGPCPIHRRSFEPVKNL